MRRITSLFKRNIAGKSIILRVDFNVEIRKGKILDDYRIHSSLPTIRWLIAKKAKLLLISHLGRPKTKNFVPGRLDHIDREYSLRPVSAYLSKLLKRKVLFFENWEDLAPFWKTLPERTIAMLENLRFWPAEEKNDSNFAKKLAELGDIYINDAFAVCHRENASLVAIAKYLPSYAGFLVSKEVEMLNRLFKNKKKPFIVVLGGAKLSDKIPLIKRFQPVADLILLGGGIANTFLFASGVSVGNSLLEKELVLEAKRILSTKSNIILPVDFRVDRKKNAIFDIGPKTEKLYSKEIFSAKVILWNGPMGLFENPKFAKGSYNIARSIAKNRNAFSVIGGGETVAVVRKLKLQKKFSFLSTGGGAMLEYLAGKKLPALAALE